jgi:hypothetical protein
MAGCRSVFYPGQEVVCVRDNTADFQRKGERFKVLGVKVYEDGSYGLWVEHIPPGSCPLCRGTRVEFYHDGNRFKPAEQV